MIDWDLTALSAQLGYTVPLKIRVCYILHIMLLSGRQRNLDDVHRQRGEGVNYILPSCNF